MNDEKRRWKGSSNSKRKERTKEGGGVAQEEAKNEKTTPAASDGVQTPPSLRILLSTTRLAITLPSKFMGFAS